MRFAALCLLVALAAPPTAPARISARHTAFPLRVVGGGFVDAAGQPVAWRGVTAFRLAELIATGREDDAITYLDWARSEQFTVVRVLLMARHLFRLAPDAGRKALPRLLDLAKERGIAVEVVALADTKEYRFDLGAHVEEVGRIAAAKQNALVEIANEPGHHTQDGRLHDPSFVEQLADLVPSDVIVALGSGEYGHRYTAGDYATFHLSRGKGWEHVLTLSEGAKWVKELGKPVVSDEPIGAGQVYDEGRRDNEPSRFAAAGALTALAGMGATFHYEAGLDAKIPERLEAECLAAWQAGVAAIPFPVEGEFVGAHGLRRIAGISGARAVFGTVSASWAAILLIDPSPSAAVNLAPGWTEMRRTDMPGVRLVVARRGS